MELTINTQQQNNLLDEWFDTVRYIDAPEDDEEEEESSEEKAIKLRCEDCGEDYFADGEEDIHAHKDSCEEKSGIRYVRTPEGARHYGQPIGTPIIAGTDIDVAPNIPVRQRATTGRRRAEDRSLPQPERTPDWRDTGFNAHSSSYESYVLQVHEIGPTHFLWSVNAPGAGKQGNRKEVASGMTSNLAEAKREATKAAKERAKERQNRVERSYENIMELWPGTYGYDWVYPDDDIEVDPKRIEEDPEYRAEIALRHSEKMGLDVVLDDRAYLPLDVNAHETLNSIMAIHEDLFPGFLELFDSIGTTGSSGVYGYNKPSVFAYGDGDDHRPGKTALRFGEDTFGERDGAYESIAHSKAYAGDIGWSACKVDRLKEQNEDDDEWRLAMMTTMTHEIGHTVGRILFGELGSYPNGENFLQQSWANPQRAEFMAQLQGYFDYYGITKNDMVGGEFSQVVAEGAHQGGAMRGIDRAVVAEMVSQYGSSSFHEMLAEVWAEYLLDDEPREFVQEIGNLMETQMVSWLEDKSKFMKKFKKGQK